PAIHVTIEGHCDDRGTREYNLALGERRATSVKNYLVADGVHADRVKTISYGKERPAVLGENEAAWAQNRRGVTVVTEQQQFLKLNEKAGAASHGLFLCAWHGLSQRPFFWPFHVIICPGSFPRLETLGCP